MRDGVVALDCSSPNTIELDFSFFTSRRTRQASQLFEFKTPSRVEVKKECITMFDCVDYTDDFISFDQAKLPRVSDLPAHFRIERRFVHRSKIVGGVSGASQTRNEVQDSATRIGLIVSYEHSPFACRHLRQFDDFLLLSRSGSGALLFHQLVETGDEIGRAHV